MRGINQKRALAAGLNAVGALALIFSAACSKLDPSGSPTLANTDPDVETKIISDRPLHRDKVVLTLKLSTPALLDVAEKTDNGIVIPDGAIEAIQQEQAEVLAFLKNLSPEVNLIFRYRMVLNAVAIVAPAALQDRISQIPGVRSASPARTIPRPIIITQEKGGHRAGEGFKRTSVDFIEATRIHNELKTKDGVPVRGQGLRVGVLDTGIDYTHRMLGGSGREEDYKAVNPNQETAAFPNKKVVGGLDLVGTEYDAASEIWTRRLPKPDANPLDEGGHGSHVAGSIAGIGDGVETYSGVAPDALLYAIKVFGADGSTDDYVVIAGLEFAADPNNDGDPSDRLDVVNLSLGGGFGQLQNLYTEAVSTLSRGGTMVVASAGNSGAIDYIVGSPSTSEDALSVAASVDDMDHNWKSPASEFQIKDEKPFLVQAVEGPVSKPIADSDGVQGKLVDIGMGDRDLNDAEKASLNGHVALLSRGGGVPFVDKLKRAVAGGAIGAVVTNNVPGDPMPMGGEGDVNIPAFMVSKEVGEALREGMKTGEARVIFKTGKTIEDPSVIDTITDFSSKGPRSDDSSLKPEIAAPGANIISAAAGSGSKGVAMSGTSMSGPHMAGVMTLLKQVHPRLSTTELKSLVMSTAKSIKDAKGVSYPLTLQGAGRVRAFAAATAALSMSQGGISLGQVQVGESKTLRREVSVRNISDEDVNISFAAEGNESLQIKVPAALSLKAGESTVINLIVTIKAPKNDSPLTELDGHLRLITKFGGDTSMEQSLPILAMVSRISDIQAVGLNVFAPSANDAADAHAELSLVNRGAQSGVALPFNLIGADRRKPQTNVTDSYRSRSCDLESAGYRVVRKSVEGQTQDMLQIAVKLFEPVTTWHYCEISVQIDTDRDGLADQELVGIHNANLSGLPAIGFASLLLDARRAREIRLNFEKKLGEGKEEPLNYIPAVMDAQPMRLYNNSTIAVVETPLKLVGLRPSGEMAVKVAALYSDTDGLNPDDFLGQQLNNWHRLNARAKEMGFYNLPETIELAPGANVTVPLNHGAGQEHLVVYMPTNRSARSVSAQPQSSVVKTHYQRTLP